MTEFRWNNLLVDCVDFAQRLIQTPSMPHEEALIAEVIAAEMQQLSFDRVWLDEMGNVFGRVNGRDRTLPALVLNSHIDHVDPGDFSLWPVPPYAGVIEDGRILGRGACDIKGPLAVQIYSVAALVRHGVRPLRDVVVCGVVQEEIGGAGSQHWVENLDYDVALVVLGEPSDNNIALGHRGTIHYWVQFHGRSVHASVPDSGENPNYALATFLERLQSARHDLSSHPLLGQTSVAPTVVQVDTRSTNVTPGWTRVLLDIRTASESPDSLRAFIARVAEGLDYSLRDEWGDPTAPPARSDETVVGFYTSPEDEQVQRARSLIERGMGRRPEFTSYRFATDGRLFTPHGLTVIGYAPGEEPLAHTVRESIAIDKMAEALCGYVQLLREF